MAMVDQVKLRLADIKEPITVAVMGCEVNGPGEAREADLGIAGGSKTGILFKKGKIIKKFPQEKLVEVLLTEVANFGCEKK